MQSRQLRKIVIGNVRIMRIPGHVILMILLRKIKRPERCDLCDDRFLKDLGAIQLLDIGLRDALLFLVGIEDLGAILRAFIGSLAV